MDYYFSPKKLRRSQLDQSWWWNLLVTIGSMILGLAILLGLIFFWVGSIEPQDQQPRTVWNQNQTRPVISTADVLKSIVPAAVGLLVLSMLTMHLRVLRRRRARLVLNHLTAAVRLRLPLPAYLLATSRTESPDVRKRLVRLAELLEHGAPIGTAIYLACGELDLRVPLMIEAAEKTGQLESTLDRLAHPAEADEDHRIVGVAPAQTLVLFLTIYLVTSMILIYVMPKFMEIMRDFGVAIPGPMQWLLRVPVDPLVVLAIPSLILIGVVLQRSTRALFSSKQHRARYSSLIDAFTWYTPVMSRLTRNRSYADFAWVLSGAIAAGHTISQGVAATNRVDVNAVFRRRLNKLDACVAGGLDFASAGAVAKMPELLVSLLKTPDGADLAKAMRFAATSYSAKRDRLLVTLKAVFPTIFTLLFGVLIAGIALALFSPMIAIIDATAKVGIRP